MGYIYRGTINGYVRLRLECTGDCANLYEILKPITGVAMIMRLFGISVEIEPGE